ncbi:hypothetical protein SAMN05444365_101831 [Micromonospora pattaloongensis]|uniref:Integral membrane protein n=1 Tax=Micromonospora pattaloongensis TaxID=405436 RepID=A0A1H3HIQ5_9ACTN|nr:hypothetical protein [Micromonospora pattaloongensis]SDY14674.1 hypothetical protein SAMN05444365_101831 [Micromonospora pattaloongensis]
MQDAGPAVRAGRRIDPDLAVAGAALALVALAVTVGAALNHAGVPVYASTAPIFARWGPRVGPGTPLALLVAAAVIRYGPTLATRLRWRRLLAAAYGGALAWTVSLALVDGWHDGLATKLDQEQEYLPEVAGVHDVPAMLRGFAGRIADFQPDSWNTHVAGHPPGALLVFVGLDRVGLGGPDWAAAACVAVGALTAVAVPVALRALGGDAAARAAVPFVVLFPGAVWLGVSADAVFAGVTAAGVALLAVGGARSGGRGLPAALAGGILLGAGLFLSYGLTLMAPLALATALVLRRVAPLLTGAAGVLAVVAAFDAAGFRWSEGYRLVVHRYYQGIAHERPYAYWAWANLACLVLAAGPVVAPVLRRVLRTLRPPARSIAARLRTPAVALPLAAAVAIAAADLSGLSKAEVERIWLPFAVWLLAGAALLPPDRRRGWLALQAVTALIVNHLLLTVW